MGLCKDIENYFSEKKMLAIYILFIYSIILIVSQKNCYINHSRQHAIYHVKCYWPINIITISIIIIVIITTI